MSSTHTPIATSWNGGELSERMHGRVDTGIYQIGAAEMLNFVPTVEGPAMKRGGFKRIRAAMSSSTWLSTFVFSVTQAYVIEWGEETLRFYTNGAFVETSPGSGTPYQVAVPYSAAEAPQVSQQQSHDRLYLAHGSHAPAALTRTSATTFSHDDLELRGGPFADQNIDESVTVAVTGTLTVGGTATVTATGGAPFLAGHVGSPILIEAKDFSDIKAWEAGMDGVSSGSTKVRSEGKAYLAASSGTTGTNPPSHSRGTEYDGQLGNDVNGNGPYGVAWTYQHDRFGTGEITAVGGGGTTATITVTRRIPDSLATVGSHRWSLGAFSDAAGWPRHVLLAFGRLIFFTDFEIVASVVGDYGGGSVNMAPFTDSGLFAPDMAFRRRLSIANPILWVKEDRDVILLGTAEGPYAIRKINSGEIFSSDNIEAVKQNHYGCAAVQPVQTGGSTIFLQLGGRKLREADYMLDSDRYVAPNINVWQRHILKSGAKQLAFQASPEELFWAVRNDGLLALHPHVPEQEVRGFARASHAAGAVLSAVSIPSDDTTHDELWALVDAGAAGKSVELQAPPWEEGESELADAFYVDSGVTVESPASVNVTGATWLANKKVHILADGAVVAPQITVAGDGSFTLPWLPEKYTVGLGYQARLTWLRPEVRGRDGNTIQGKRKRLVSIALRLLETVGIKVDPGSGHADQIVDRPGSAPMDAPVPPFTGDTTAKSLSGNWGRGGQGTIISDDPLPCMVIAAMPTIEVGDR